MHERTRTQLTSMLHGPRGAGVVEAYRRIVWWYPSRQRLLAAASPAIRRKPSANISHLTTIPKRPSLKQAGLSDSGKTLAWFNPLCQPSTTNQKTLMKNSSQPAPVQRNERHTRPLWAATQCPRRELPTLHPVDQIRDIHDAVPSGIDEPLGARTPSRRTASRVFPLLVDFVFPQLVTLAAISSLSRTATKTRRHAGRAADDGHNASVCTASCTVLVFPFSALPELQGRNPPSQESTTPGLQADALWRRSQSCATWGGSVALALLQTKRWLEEQPIDCASKYCRCTRDHRAGGRLASHIKDSAGDGDESLSCYLRNALRVCL